MGRPIKSEAPAGVAKYIPAASLIQNYQRTNIRWDIIAGLTAWAMVVPEGMAYASIAGMPPEAALYAAMAATLLYFLFGTSRDITVGPGSAIAIMSASVIVGLGLAPNTDDWIAATTALALVVGVICIIAGFLRLGFISEFISKPVLQGFVTGIALVIIVGQAPKFFGVEGGDGNFWQQLATLIGELGSTNLVVLAVGVGSYILLEALKLYVPKIPAALIAVVASIVAVTLFNLEELGVHVAGMIPQGLPSLGFPDVDLDLIIAVTPGAIGVVIVAYAETLSAARTFAARKHYDIEPNQEFKALGWSNLGAGMSQGFTVDGSLSRSAAKYEAKVKTQLSLVVTSLAILITLLFLTPIFANLAEATLAAIVVHAVLPLLKPKMWKNLYRVARLEFWAAATAGFIVTLVGTLEGLLYGVGLSLAVVIGRAAYPYVAELGHIKETDTYVDVEVNEEAHRIPGIVILRPEATLFFANATYLHDRVIRALEDADPEASSVLLDMEGVARVDLTASRSLLALKEELDGLDIVFGFTRVRSTVRKNLRRFEVEESIGAENFYLKVDDAVKAIAAETEETE